ncbi:MAG: hypothetical protein ABWX84_03385 [Nocardioides sp.]
MAAPADRSDGPDTGPGWHEIVATALLVLTAVATSWSSYQATRWHGEQAATANRTSALRIQGASAAALGEAETQVDVATFIAWVNADQAEDEQLAEFYVARFRPEFKTAFDAWQATRPLTNPSAPPTPFAMPEYQVANRNKATQLNKAAEASALRVGENIQRASNYVLTVVLYAVVLFFAGMSTKLKSRRLRTITLVAGCVVLVCTLAWIATFPVSVKV